MLKNAAPILHAFAEGVQRPLLTDHGSQLSSTESGFLTASRQLAAHERFAIYNQQYWLRFYKLMESSFPTVARLFGSQPFHQGLVVPYIQACPPSHWSIDLLGERFVTWLESSYQESDRALVLQAAQLDWAIWEGMLVADLPPATAAQAATEVLQLQPHVSLWHLPWHLPPVRQALLERDVDGWLNDPFPELVREECWWVLGRSRDGLMIWRRLSGAQYQLLGRLQLGSTLAAALESVSEEELPEVSAGITSWLMEWSFHHWLVVS
jgi:hypothetical protein